MLTESRARRPSQNPVSETEKKPATLRLVTALLGLGQPGFTPNTGLGREANAFLRFLANYLLPLLAPHIKYWSTPKKASRVSAEVLINTSGQTGIYYDENAHPMLGSSLVRDTEFQDRVVAETRALL